MQEDEKLTPQSQPDVSPPTPPVESDPALSLASPAPASETTQQVPETMAPPTPEKPAKKEGGIFSFIATLAIAFVLVQVINMFLFQSYKVFGSSMVPTLHDGDRLIISKIGKTASKLQRKDYVPERGDVVVFVDPQRSDLQLIKRVIGLPGERVVVKDGKITVYNKENPNGYNPDTQGEYTAELPRTSGENDVTVPQKHLFVSGDNREGSNSLDSRNELGTVPEELVVGTLKVRIWPFSDARFF